MESRTLILSLVILAVVLVNSVRSKSIDCGPVCLIACKYGNVLDEDGCPTCKCKPGPCPPVLCDIYCPYGNVLDRNGCSVCKCKPEPCPPVCLIYCSYGNVLDKNGCPTCQCKEGPAKI